MKKNNYSLNYDLSWNDIFLNLFSSKKNRIKAYCGNCNRYVFNLNSSWAKKGLCVYCGGLK